MAFQNKATDYIQPGYEGDRVGGPFYPDKSYMVTGPAGVKIGKFVWKVKDTENQIAQAKGTNVELAGLVYRSQTNVNATQGITTGYSMVIAQGQFAEVNTRGQYRVKIDTVAGSNPVAQDSAVYTDDNGNIVADGGGDLSTYIKTNFKFDSVSAELIATGLVKISNVNDVV